MLLRWVFILSITALIQWYAFQAIKTLTSNKSLHIIYGVVVLVILLLFYWQAFFYDRAKGFSHFM